MSENEGTEKVKTVGETSTERFIGVGRQVFLLTAVVVFLVTAASKIATAVSGRPYLSTPAPIFPEVNWRELLLLAAGLEFATSAFVLWRWRSRVSLWAVFWLSLVFGLYRWLLFAVAYHGPCNCLGMVGDWLPFSSQVENRISLLLLGYLLAGSIGSLLLMTGSKLRVTTPLCATLLLLSQAVPVRAQSQALRLAGEENVFAEYKGLEQHVQRIVFVAVCAGSNWQLAVTYPQVGSVDCYAMVSGLAYLTSGSNSNTNVAGGVLTEPMDMLEAMTESARVGFFALLYAPTTASGLDNSVASMAPFVPPRYPGILCYTSVIKRFDEYPQLPLEIEWAVDTECLGRIPAASLERYFGSQRLGRKTLRSFADSQQGGARYSVVSSTNAHGLVVPLRATLIHNYYDLDGKSGRRRFEISVNEVETVQETDLKPTINPGSRVTHVIDGKSYVYSSSDGRWLGSGDARSIGRLIDAAPRQPKAAEGGRLVGTIRILIVCLILLPLTLLMLYVIKHRTSLTKNKGIHK